jgi:hypothetical protein
MLMQFILFASLTWGPYTVSWQKFDPDKLPEENLVLHITRDNHPVRAIGIWQAEAETLDIDNDGISELLITDFSGGAHCCFTYYLYSRSPDLRLLGVFEMGNGGLRFEDLDGDGILEGVGDYDGFAYYDFCYAASPFLPLVFSLTNGRYVEDTKSYPNSIKKALLDRVAHPPADTDEDYRKSQALALFALSLLVQDEDSAWKLIEQRTPSMVSWLHETAGEIKKILEDRKTRVKYKE